MSFSEKYERIRLLGEGAFGAAYLVRPKQGPRVFNVAKEIRCHHLSQSEKDGALAESNVLKMMKHPNVIGYIDSFIEDTKMYIIMEYANGGDLSTKIKDARTEGVTFQEREVMYIFLQIVSALRHIHERKVLHRDLKPLNVFLTKDGVVKLGDFGIARVLESTAAVAETCIGSPYYLSPEICNSEAYGMQTDVWSLGVIVYELMVLKVPFHGTNMAAVALKIISTDPDPLPGTYSKDLESIVLRFLEKEPKMRPRLDEVWQMPFVQRYVEQFWPNSTESGTAGCEAMSAASGGTGLCSSPPGAAARRGGRPKEATPSSIQEVSHAIPASEQRKPPGDDMNDTIDAAAAVPRSNGAVGRTEAKAAAPQVSAAGGRRAVKVVRQQVVARDHNVERDQHAARHQYVARDQLAAREQYLAREKDMAREEYHRNIEARIETKRRIEQQTREPWREDEGNAVAHMERVSVGTGASAVRGRQTPAVRRRTEDALADAERRKEEVRRQGQQERDDQVAARQRELERARREMEEDRRLMQERLRARQDEDGQQETSDALCGLASPKRRDEPLKSRGGGRDPGIGDDAEHGEDADGLSLAKGGGAICIPFTNKVRPMPKLSSESRPPRRTSSSPGELGNAGNARGGRQNSGSRGRRKDPEVVVKRHGFQPRAPLAEGGTGGQEAVVEANPGGTARAGQFARGRPPKPSIPKHASGTPAQWLRFRPQAATTDSEPAHETPARADMSDTPAALNATLCANLTAKSRRESAESLNRKSHPTSQGDGGAVPAADVLDLTLYGVEGHVPPAFGGRELEETQAIFVAGGKARNNLAVDPADELAAALAVSVRTELHWPDEERV